MASLRRLNLDSSWLITLPASPGYGSSTVNILLDPWLDPSEQIDFARSFSSQRRRVPALASSIDELESLLQRRRQDDEHVGGNGQGVSRSCRIDAIVISHPFTDHMHPATLHSASLRSIPILVTKDTIGPVKQILPQADVYVIPTANVHDPPVWPSEIPRWPLSQNVQILQALPQERMSLLKGPASIAWQRLHGGLLFLWRAAEEVDGRKSLHSIVYSPHGITRKSIPRWLSLAAKQTQQGPSSTSALITSFDRIELPTWLSGTVNLGLQRALDILEVYPAAYLIETHGEHKEKRGLVAKLLRRYWLGSQEEMLEENVDVEQEQARQSQAQAIVDGGSECGQRTQVAVLDVDGVLLL